MESELVRGLTGVDAHYINDSFDYFVAPFRLIYRDYG